MDRCLFRKFEQHGLSGNKKRIGKKNLQLGQLFMCLCCFFLLFFCGFNFAVFLICAVQYKPCLVSKISILFRKRLCLSVAKTLSQLVFYFCFVLMVARKSKGCLFAFPLFFWACSPVPSRVFWWVDVFWTWYQRVRSLHCGVFFLEICPFHFCFFEFGRWKWMAIMKLALARDVE